MVRSWLCLHGKATNKGLHKAAITYVSAPAQAQRCRKFLPILTEEEQKGARKTLTAAAMTYVAATATALAQLLRIIVLFGRRNNDRI